MLEKFVESKIKIERARIDKYDDITRGDIRKSHLPAPIKRYVLARFEGKLSNAEFTALLTKAIKLNINYTIRPGWTLLNFLFSKYDSQQAEVIKEKSDVFTFYRFYIDFILNYIDEHSLVVITKDKVARFIKEANRALHEKLVTNITGVKVKNFFIQLYRLAEKNQEDVNLTSTAPFLFIKTFLEDKEYDDILQKFNSIPDITNETEISLKDCIKIVSDKFPASAPPPPEKIEMESTDIFPEEEDEKGIENEIIVENTDVHDDVISDTGEEIDDDGGQDNIQEEEKDTDEGHKLSIKLYDHDDKAGTMSDDEERNNDDSGVIDVDFPEDGESGEDEEAIDPIVTDDDDAPDDDTLRKDPVKEENKLPTEVISESNLDIDKKSISRLFKHGELVSICQTVYNGDKHKMHESFRELNGFSEWKDASGYIKELFYDNDVDIYNKSVLLFVDVLQDYYNQIDGK